MEDRGFKAQHRHTKTFSAQKRIAVTIGDEGSKLRTHVKEDIVTSRREPVEIQLVLD